ncbi:MAG: hypothetical protein L0154_18020, partial [Chloroflexi bacterium]|nr:hypothetical protein [Chloroflexota bacterium]
TSFISYARDIEVSYYIFDERLQPAEPVFAQFADGEIVPNRITADGKYVLAITPNENPGTQPSGAYIAPRYQGLYAVDGNVELADVGSSKMFGDHFFADWLSLWDPETQMTVDRFSFNELVGRIDCMPYGNCALDGYNHGYYLAQVNDKALLYVTGTNAIVLPIEYQRVDDLLTVGEPLFSMPRGDYEKTYITPDASAILAADADSLEWISVSSGNTREFDLTPYLGEDSRLEVVIREEDVFLQTEGHLLRVSLPEMTLLDSITVDNPITEQYLYGSPYFDQRLVVQGDTVAALFDDVVLVWQENGIAEYSIGEFGMTLYPIDNGWIIHHLSAGVWENTLIHCDLLLTDCQKISLDRSIYAVFSDNRILTGSQIFDDEDTIPPQLWRIEGGELVSLAPLLDLPDARFNPVEIHGDTVLVDGPDVWDTDYAHVYQVWSLSENRRLSRQMLADDGYGGRIQWHWLDNYFVMSNGGWVTFVHLPDGRFRYWRMRDFSYPDDAVQSIQISEQHLLVVTEAELTLYPFR